MLDIIIGTQSYYDTGPDKRRNALSAVFLSVQAGLGLMLYSTDVRVHTHTHTHFNPIEHLYFTDLFFVSTF